MDLLLAMMMNDERMIGILCDLCRAEIEKEIIIKHKFREHECMSPIMRRRLIRWIEKSQ
jgi:hypothetical protein